MGAKELTDALDEASDINKYLNRSAIGLAFLDYEDFRDGKYFPDGKIYIDEDKSTYKIMEYGSKGIFSLFGMANPMVYVQARKASNKGITGNMKGDGFQLGGTIIVNQQGNIIFSHNQTSYTDHPDPAHIIEAIRNYSMN